jgi:hypothetical protein
VEIAYFLHLVAFVGVGFLGFLGVDAIKALVRAVEYRQLDFGGRGFRYTKAENPVAYKIGIALCTVTVVILVALFGGASYLVIRAASWAGPFTCSIVLVAYLLMLSWLARRLASR